MSSRNRNHLRYGAGDYHLIVALITLLTLVVVACGSGESAVMSGLIEPASPVGGRAFDGAPRPRIALVMRSLNNPLFAEIERGARQAAAELQVELIVKTTAQETAIDQQIAIIERLILDQVDAIVIAPSDSASLVPALKHAQAAGIAIVNLDNRLDPDLARELGLVAVPFISVDNDEAAYMAARYLSLQITTPTEVLILEGVPTAQNAIDRTRGALRAFAENPNLTVVAIESAHWKIDEGYALTRTLLHAHPRVGAIFCANDMMALGALKYLAEVGRSEILVAGFDALVEARHAIKAGRLAATVDQQAARQGYLGVRSAVDLLAGEQLPPETLIPVELITAAQP